MADHSVAPDLHPENRHVGHFLIENGRCEIYRRRNAVTLFFMVSGKAFAAHMTVPDAIGVGNAIITAGETTPYDEAPPALVDESSLPGAE